MIESELVARAQDLSLYVRFVAVFVAALGLVQLWQGYRDVRYAKLLLAGAVTIVGVLSVVDPAVVLDRV